MTDATEFLGGNRTPLRSTKPLTRPGQLACRPFPCHCDCRVTQSPSPGALSASTSGRMAVALLIGIGVLRCVAGEDWPHARGPGYDAHVHSASAVLRWGESGPPVLWKVAPGHGFSGFAVVDGKVFTQAQTAVGQFVLCLHLESGRELWRSRYGAAWEHEGMFPGTYAAPTVHAGRVLFAGCAGAVGCMDAETGELLWQVDLARDFGAATTGFGYACSPLVHEGKVILAAGGEDAAVLALDIRDGTLLWRAGSDPATYVPPLPISVAGRTQVVAFLDNATVAHDPETGAELWRDNPDLGYNPDASWPVYEEPYLFRASTFCHGARVLRLGYVDDRPVSEVVWAGDVMSNDVLSCVVVDGFVYGFDIHDGQSNINGGTDGEFKCVELATGNERWCTRETGAASVLARGTELILFSEDGVLIIAEATPWAYRELARAPVLPGELCWTQPAFSRDRLLVRSRSHIACVHLGARGVLGRSTLVSCHI